MNAVKHRHDRNKLQQEKKIDRGHAEELLQERRLEDLNVWESCIPKHKSGKCTSRKCRAQTRQITSQLKAANLETKGAVNPLSKIDKISKKTRDATPEVYYDIILLCLCVFLLACVCFRRRCNTSWTKR